MLRVACLKFSYLQENTWQELFTLSYVSMVEKITEVQRGFFFRGQNQSQHHLQGNSKIAKESCNFLQTSAQGILCLQGPITLGQGVMALFPQLPNKYRTSVHCCASGRTGHADKFLKLSACVCVFVSRRVCMSVDAMCPRWKGEVRSCTTLKKLYFKNKNREEVRKKVLLFSHLSLNLQHKHMITICGPQIPTV